MPCRVDVPYEEEISPIKKQLDAMTTRANKLTAENDSLREVIINVATDPQYVIPEKVLNKVKVTQINHRKEDLKRLEKVFRKSRDAQRLGLVLLADPSKPLEPQLGFDADAY